MSKFRVYRNGVIDTTGIKVITEIGEAVSLKGAFLMVSNDVHTRLLELVNNPETPEPLKDSANSMIDKLFLSSLSLNANGTIYFFNKAPTMESYHVEEIR